MVQPPVLASPLDPPTGRRAFLGLTAGAGAVAATGVGLGRAVAGPSRRAIAVAFQMLVATLLGHGLVIQTDDVLLYAKSQTEMLEILELFLSTVATHRLCMHPASVNSL